jgi:hypothetical protein
MPTTTNHSLPIWKQNSRTSAATINDSFNVRKRPHR